jgi:hypothetical protein
MISRSKIVELAREELGTPFLHQGRVPGHWLDCIGIFVVTVRKAGLKIRDYTRYKRFPRDSRLVDELRDQLIEIDPKAARLGDIFAMWWYLKDVPQHLAMKTEKGIIHSVFGKKRGIKGGVREEPLTEELEEKIITAFSIPGVV